jgi:hypothetical protein
MPELEAAPRCRRERQITHTGIVRSKRSGGVFGSVPLPEKMPVAGRL